MTNRREFLEAGLKTAAGICLFCALPSVSKSDDLTFGNSENQLSLVEAKHYRKLNDKRIECELCPRKCQIADLERGYCGVRENRDGKYYSLVHSRVCSANADPIEKKPLFHFLPGTGAFSIATAGCNIECKFCQNWEIAQKRPEQIRSVEMPPSRITELAGQYKCGTIAYTYSEPVVFFEYMYDTASYSRGQGLRNVMISNGYINEKPMRELCKVLSAVKIDLKAFTDSFYKNTCSGELKPVLDTLLVLKDEGIWFELVILIVPTLNDSTAEISRMCRWVKKNLGSDVPMHFTRFHPSYKLQNLPPTPIKTLENVYKTANAEGIKFAYLGNIPGHEAENTFCPGCGKILIERAGFHIRANHIKKGKCGFCEISIPGVWE